MFDYDVYALCGDGDMMEGVSSEAASLAGHLGLSNLCWIYDNNHITIEGHTELAFSEDVATRFIAYGWNVTRVGRCQRPRTPRARLRDVQEHRRTVPRSSSSTATSATARPTSRTRSAAHGEPLGEEEVRLTKRSYGWPEDAKFLVPDGVREHFAEASARAAAPARAEWMASASSAIEPIPDLAEQLFRMQHRELPDGWDDGSRCFRPTRRASPAVIPRQGAQRPGAADTRG